MVSELDSEGAGVETDISAGFGCRGIAGWMAGAGLTAVGCGAAGLNPPGAGAITPGGVNTGRDPGMGIGLMAGAPAGFAASGMVIRMVSELGAAPSAGTAAAGADGTIGVGAAIGIGAATVGLGIAGVIGLGSGIGAAGVGLMAVG